MFKLRVCVSFNALDQNFVLHTTLLVIPHCLGQVPVVKLNYTVLSNNTGLDRDVVELCVCDIFRAFSRSLANGRNIDFDFSGVGRLVIREKKARMKFFKEFIKAMDVSGTLKSAFVSMDNKFNHAWIHYIHVHACVNL